MAQKMNYDRAKWREWQAEARREKAMEIAHEQTIRIANREAFLASPATEAQRRLVIKYEMHKHCGHPDSYLDTMTIRQADALIKKYGADHGWKKKSNPTNHRYKARKKKKQEYKPLKTAFESQGTPNMSGPNIIRSKGKPNITE